jgi:hypothetical protein
MNTLRIAFVATLLSASSVYADTAPHWSAAIGTRHASSSSSSITSPVASTNTAGFNSSPHWSAFIGTGRSFEGTRVSSAKSSAATKVSASAHWGSMIGTGHAADSNARTPSLEVSASRAQP